MNMYPFHKIHTLGPNNTGLVGSPKKEKLNLFLYCTYSYISRSIFEEDLDLLLFFSNLSKLMSSFSSFGGT